MSIHRTRLAAVTAVLCCATAAGAADLYPIYGQMVTAPELTPVEIGNGWYIRGDVSYDLETDFDGRMSGLAPAEASFDTDDLRLENGFAGGLGIGYRLNDILRTDVTARYGKSDLELRGSFPFADLLVGAQDDCGAYRCSFTEGGETTSWDLMANAYVDLGTFAGLTPYVGAGAGAYRLEYEGAGLDCETSPSFMGCVTPTATGTDSWRFAYALSAGIAYDLTKSLKIDVGYRYLNVDGGDAYDVTTTLQNGLTNTFSLEDDGFDRHTIQAGIRYSLW